MASTTQQNGPTEAALNCLSILAQQLGKETLKGINWDQAAADAGMSSGRSFRDTMRRHCRKNGWFGETGAPSGTVATTAAAACPAANTEAAVASSPAADADAADANTADAAATPTVTGKRKTGMVLRSGRKRVKMNSSEEEEESSEEESEGEDEGEDDDEEEELNSPSTSSSDSDSE